MQGLTIGFGLTGSHCTYNLVLPTMEHMVEQGANVIPIISQTVANTDTRFGNAKSWLAKIKQITGKDSLTSIPEVEPFGPKKNLDCLVIAPCTGNTLARIANAITDGPILMAVKAQLRTHRPVVLAISTNDALGFNASNLAKLLVAKDLYFVPFGQDDPHGKPKSMVAEMSLIEQACQAAMQGKQLQPLILAKS
ncbi:MAG: hypothetical protein RLZ12_150 [Bacillota bacterium]|jgi:dipicolinate synthase subunit B